MNAADDRLTLRGMRFVGRHGVHPEEKIEPQPFEVDLVLHADLTRASTTDALADTVDYGGLFEVTRSIVEERSFDLIERMAGAIADEVLAHTPAELVAAAEVRVRKPRAPLPGDFDTVEATLIRRRPEAAREMP